MATYEKPSMDVYYEQGPAEYQKQAALYAYQQGDTSATWNDPTYGARSVADYFTPGTETYQLFNPATSQQKTTSLQQAQDIYQQTTGQALAGQGLETVQSHIATGATAQEALSNLGNLNWWAKNTTSSGEPLVYAGQVNESGFALDSGIPSYQSRVEASRMQMTPEQQRMFQQAGLLPGGQITTTDFANAFKAQYGTAPSNQELLAFTNMRASGLPLDQIVTQVKAKTFADTTLEPPSTVISTEGMGKDVSQVDLSKSITGIGGKSGVQSDMEAASALTEAKSFIENRLKLLEQTKTEEQKQAGTLMTDIQEALGELSGKAAFTTQKEQELLSPLENQLTTLNAQIGAKEADKARLIAEQQGKPITMSSIIGSVAQINAVLNADILTLTAQANAVVGQIANAQKQIERAVAAKYGPLEEEIAIKQSQLQAIQPLLTKQDQAQADALSAYYAQQAQVLADKKADEQNKLNLMVNAINAGISDQNILDQIKNAKSYSTALSIYGANAPKQVTSQIIGTAETGYKLVSYDKQGNLVSTKPISGGYDPNGIPPPPQEGLSFDEFVAKREEQMGMSIADRESLRGDYEQAQQAGYQPLFSYGEVIDVSTLPSLPGKKITDKTARENNLPFGITQGQANYIMENRPGNSVFQTLKPVEFDKLADLIDLGDKIEEIKELKKRVRTGKLQGTEFAATFTPRRLGEFSRQDFFDLRVKTGKELAEFIKDISGAAVSEQEAQRLAKLVPNVKMGDTEFLSALDEMEREYSRQVSNKLSQFGLANEDELVFAVTGSYPIDLKTGLNNLSPEQEAELRAEGLIQ